MYTSCSAYIFDRDFFKNRLLLFLSFFIWFFCYYYLFSLDDSHCCLFFSFQNVKISVNVSFLQMRRLFKRGLISVDILKYDSSFWSFVGNKICFIRRLCLYTLLLRARIKAGVVNRVCLQQSLTFMFLDKRF